MDLFEVTPSSGFRKGMPPRNYSNLIRWLPQNFHRNTREPAVCCNMLSLLPQEIVTRWTSKTRIEYRPHAKAPGSKSHIRLLASWSRWFYLPGKPRNALFLRQWLLVLGVKLLKKIGHLAFQVVFPWNVSPVGWGVGFNLKKNPV